MSQTITISKKEYETLKKQAPIDLDMLKQFMDSLSDIKAGRVKKVKSAN